MRRNIHILPAITPTTLSRGSGIKNLFYCPNTKMYDNNVEVYQYVYITDNYSDINENDYIITKDGRLVQVSYLLSKDLEQATKVVITSDPELIKDDIKEVSEGFVEWLVENPDCDYVQVEIDYIKFKKGNITISQCYMIEIPKKDTDFLGRTYFDQLKQEAIEEEMEEYYKEVEVITYTEDEVKDLIWESRKLFTSDEYLNIVKRNRKFKFLKWFNQNKKK